MYGEEFKQKIDDHQKENVHSCEEQGHIPDDNRGMSVYCICCGEFLYSNSDEDDV